MYKLTVLLFVALLASVTVSFRIRRQSDAVPKQVSIDENTNNTATTAVPSYTIVFVEEETNTTVSDFATSIVTKQCIEDCPVLLPDITPVCGSDGKVYANQGSLYCAQLCGSNVTMVKYAPCT